NRGVGLYKTFSLKKLMNGHDDGVPDAEYGPLAFAAQPEVAVVHQKIYPMFFGGDGEILGDMNDVESCNLEFMPADLAFVGDDEAGDADRTFLAEAFGIFEEFGADFIFVDH